MSFFVLQGKPGTRLASSEIVSDQLQPLQCIFYRETDLVGRTLLWFGGDNGQTEEARASERERVTQSALFATLRGKTDSPLGRKLRKRKRRERETKSRAPIPPGLEIVSFEEARLTLPHKGKTSKNPFV